MGRDAGAGQTQVLSYSGWVARKMAGSWRRRAGRDRGGMGRVRNVSDTCRDYLLR